MPHSGAALGFIAGFAFVIAMALGLKNASAATITFSFSAEVTQIIGQNDYGVGVGHIFNGTISATPNLNDRLPTAPHDFFYTGSGSGSALGFNIAGTELVLVSGYDTDPFSPQNHAQISLYSGPPSTYPYMLLGASSAISDNPIDLFSLAPNMSSAVALYPNIVFFGSISTSPDSALAFKVTDFTTATTPIPAALPLFAAALGGLGLVGWRRRNGAVVE